MNRPRRLYVIDTNVLANDPRALARFQEHDILIPTDVLEELDSLKQGSSDVARNVREVSRILDEMVSDADRDTLERGIALPGASDGATGRLFLEVRTGEPPALTPFVRDTPDNRILACALDRARTQPDVNVVLVTRDINLRIKARSLGLAAEDYTTDRVVDDLALLPSGVAEVAGGRLAAAADQARFDVPVAAADHWYPRLGLFDSAAPAHDSQVTTLDADRAAVLRMTDYRERHRVWGVSARNREQNFALNLLMDPDVDLVTLLGAAGTGKTLLALAAGLAQTLDDQRYREIIVTRATIPVGEDIGYLPGTEEEKMTPWMGALMDNLEVLVDAEPGAGAWGRSATSDLLSHRVKLRSLSFMRGRTFLNRYVVIDEAQNLTRNQMKTLITRAGPGTKMICLGNIAQIDSPYVSETTSGLTYVVDRFRNVGRMPGTSRCARGERSRLADFAADWFCRSRHRRRQMISGAVGISGWRAVLDISSLDLAPR